MFSASICSLPPIPGYGDCNTDHEEHFYFDKYELRCKKFLFMNCLGGNENRFVTEAQCNRFCQSSACAAGEAVAVSSSGVPLICDKPSICPHGYKCVYNKLFNRHHCCGFSNNGGVCPVDSVSYTSLATGAALRCIPSTRSDSCPEGFICVGKGQSGYCCKPKGWCPNDSRPFSSPNNGQPQKCTVGVTVCRLVKLYVELFQTLIHRRHSGLPLPGTNQPTNIPPMRSVVFDLMTVLTCPDALSPSYLTNSQLIIECTETEQSTTTCPAPARCVRAPRDVLRRSVCCSGFNGS
ncbi:unnamed protein product [Haemonchus placei]|uniref:BPTI/Kunitz inhibitor domain-containing protein n=1 Tax=Haemonchus placei TaxID=6290 RepID=A0A158QRW1_HAEPC|nr:unnamed protein product [Haemonchus placei]